VEFEKNFLRSLTLAIYGKGRGKMGGEGRGWEGKGRRKVGEEGRGVSPPNKKTKLRL
jgi:hypothetical protein